MGGVFEKNRTKCLLCLAGVLGSKVSKRWCCVGVLCYFFKMTCGVWSRFWRDAAQGHPPPMCVLWMEFGLLYKSKYRGTITILLFIGNSLNATQLYSLKMGGSYWFIICAEKRAWTIDSPPLHTDYDDRFLCNYKKKQAFSQGQLLFDSIIDMCGRVGRQKIEW
jgi:hypothetical protein